MSADTIPANLNIRSILGGLPIIAGYQPQEQVLVLITAPLDNGAQHPLSLVAGARGDDLTASIQQARANIDQIKDTLPPDVRAGAEHPEAFLAIYSDSADLVTMGAESAVIDKALIDAGIEPRVACPVRGQGSEYCVLDIDHTPRPVDQKGQWVTALRELLGDPLESRGDLSTASGATRQYDPAAVSDALMDAAKRFVDPEGDFPVSGSAEASFYIVDHLSDPMPMTNAVAGELLLLLADDAMVRGVNETLAVCSPADRDLALARLAELDTGSPTPSASTGPRSVALAAAMLNGDGPAAHNAANDLWRVPVGEPGSELLELHYQRATAVEVSHALAPEATDPLTATPGVLAADSTIDPITGIAGPPDVGPTDPLGDDPLSRPFDDGPGPAPGPDGPTL